MIINCEKCSSNFNLDENLLDEKGSKVRCSVCKNIFMVLPPEPADDDYNAALEETVDLDSLEFEEDTASEPDEKIKNENFDKAFDDALKEDIQEEDIEEETEPEIQTPPVKRKNKAPGLVLISLIIILILILGALSVYLFAPSLLPDNISGMQPPEEEDLTDPGNRRLDIIDTDGSFLPTDKIGQLYIIKGKIVNDYPQSRSYILLKGTIEDGKKNILDRKLAYAGNIFTEHELKDITIEKIEERLKNKSGRNNSNINITSQETVPFMIIFYNLPDTKSVYAVETVSSLPGE